MTGRVVADSSFLIGAARARAFEQLRERFASIAITRLVKDEVMARPELPGARELDAAMRAGWIRVAPTPLATWQFADLDPGEASALALALERDGSLVLIDDALGRTRARALGLATLTLAEVLGTSTPTHTV
jgi:predicted nucleic acid-binding protein